ncbi:amidohydrolase family protein [Robiginitomaculum antarcticum]|uniref:amidohydrolase family protein n=1 Tax=Robiginitomaculum antarcticum TaxID=437507 RepID=UPI0003741AC3|nr:amidohydrolase family protein [Robiginitomaculum antarcticum]
MRKLTLLAGTALFATGLITAQTVMADETKEDAKWDVNNPPGAKNSVKIDVTEGTWMSLDVSPDGQTIAFDLLGDIYTMPITGGTAKSIASGMAWEIQPRFSPDGSKIAFTSDRGGGDNIWIMDVNGDNMSAVTDESFRLLNNPTWSPDGRFIAARKHFTTSRSLGTGEMWLYSTQGGSGVQLTKKPSEAHQKEIGEPIFSPDGSLLYYTANTTSGPIFEYAQDSNTALFDIKSYDMKTGEVKTVVRGAGGAVRPTPSPDGRSMAYVRRERAQSKLYIMDLESGKTRKVYDELDQDMQETWAVQGVYPNMDFTPDGRHLLFWAGGKIRKLDITSGAVQTVDFRVNDRREIMAPPRPKVDVAPKQFQTKMVRFATRSPDGNSSLFESLGKLYKKSGGGAAQRVTGLPSNMFELHPAYSRDGKKLTFATWNDQTLGGVHVMDIASGAITTVTNTPGHYRRPAFSPDGTAIVFERSTGGGTLDPQYSRDPGIYYSRIGGPPQFVMSDGNDPHFGADSDRVFATKSQDDTRALVSADLGGNDMRTHATSTLAQSFYVSPDERNIAFRENYNLFVMPAPVGAATIATGPSSKTLPVTKVSINGATWPSWSPNGQRLDWSLGPTLYSADVASMDKDYTPPKSGIALARTVQAARPEGSVALTGARIITMNGDDGGVIENGVIIVNGDRIERIGAADRVSIPDGMVTVDVTGKTIMPGIIDAHAHGPQGSDEIVPQQNWASQAHLALGVTTIHDPSSRASEIFTASEMQRAGIILAPRIFSTGEVIYGAKAPGFYASITNADDAQEHVTRLATQGAKSVKNYNQPRRDQRQQVVAAARKENIAVVAEGGSLYHMDMSMVVDGNTSIEHNLPTLDIYDDVVQLYGQSKVAYTPTLVVTYGGVRGEDYYYQESDVWTHPILSRHVPPRRLEARSVRRQMAPVGDYADAKSAASAKKLMEAGVLVNIGAHGQREGLGAHWEIWSFARGGMSPLQALKTATINPAKFLGYDNDIGSLETGKLADLVILSGNPLEDIRQTDDIEHVMIGGRLYESGTLNEVFTGNRTRLPYWFEGGE